MINQPNNQCCKDWIEVNEFQAKQIAELEQQLEQYRAFEKWVQCFTMDELEEHNLGQQAKGIATFLLKADASEVVFGSVSDLVIEAHKEIEKLLNKVAKIKVQE